MSLKNTGMFLIFPPCWNITHPYTALPHLKGFAGSLGYSIDICDNCLDFFDTVFSQEYIDPVVRRACKDFKQMDSGDIPADTDTLNKLRLISLYSDQLSHIEDCRTTINSTKDPDVAKYCIQVLNAALSAIGYVYDMELWYDTVSPHSHNVLLIDDLMNYINDENKNLFLDYYRNGPGKKLIEKAVTYKHVGISVTGTSQLIPALIIASEIKKADSKVIVHFGGCCITSLANLSNSREILPKLLTNVDFILLYEGETVLEKIWAGEDYHVCPNVVYLENGKVCKTEKAVYHPREFVIPDYSGLNLDSYFISERVLSLMTSRGCYNRCSFCSRTATCSCQSYHGFDVDAVAACIRQLKEKYQVSSFFFNDEVLNLKRMVKLAAALKDDGVSWLVETRMDEKLSNEEFRCIAEGGCRYLLFGLESYNQRVLDLMNKNISVEDIDPLVCGCLNNNIPVILYAMFGFPGETEEEMECTRRYLLEVKKRMNKKGYYYGGTGFGPFTLYEDSYVFMNPDTYGIEILPNPEGSLSLSHQYRYKDGRLSSDGKAFATKIEKRHSIGYPDFLPLDYALINHNRVTSAVSVPDKTFVNNTDLEGKKDIFKYFYNYQSQLLVPVPDAKIEGGLKAVYGHEPLPPFEKNSRYCLNPFIQVDNFVLDTVSLKKYKVDPRLLSLLNKLKSMEFFTPSSLAEEEYYCLEQIYMSGFILGIAG